MTVVDEVTPEVVTETDEVVSTEETAPTILADLSTADPATQAMVPLITDAANGYNAIKTANSAKTRGVDEIVADLVETSQNEKVVALRAKRDEISEAIAKAVTAEAKAMKENAGEPDLDAEKNAKTQYDSLLKALHTFPDGKKVGHFLPAIVGGGTKASGSSNSGPVRDMTAVRDWAKNNGFEVKDKGRLSAEIVEAYNKANPGSTV